jgi:novobiocin biosynthesis protein NovU/D-mycarose 3-C-methyltransferase
MRCTDCGLLQLKEVVAPEILYDEYAYAAGSGGMQKEMFRDLVNAAYKRCNRQEFGVVLDIGGNDGALLREFDTAYRINADPNATVPEWAKARSEEIYMRYLALWSPEIAIHHEAQCDIITATNSFAHIDNLNRATMAVAIALKSDGYFIIQVPWVRDLSYDTIYHEHLSYFSIAQLRRLFQKHWMDIKHVDYLPDIHGGTIRVWVGHGNDGVDDSVAELIVEEEKAETNIAERFASHRSKLREFLPDRFWLYGASAKATMLINLCGLQDRVALVLDDTKEKQGKDLPGTEALITNLTIAERMASFNDPILIGAWNYLERIKNKLREANYKGDVIVPFPEPRVEEL